MNSTTKKRGYPTSLSDNHLCLRRCITRTIFRPSKPDKPQHTLGMWGFWGQEKRQKSLVRQLRFLVNVYPILFLLLFCCCLSCTIAYTQKLLQLPAQIGILHNTVDWLSSCAIQIHRNQRCCVAWCSECVSDTTLGECKVGLVAGDW